MATTYSTEKLIAGRYTTQQVKLNLDTYYTGMPLEYDAANDRYQYLAAGAIAGFFYESDIDPDLGRDVLLNGWGGIITSGELLASGIVTDLNAPYTMTEDLFAAWAVPGGFQIKRG